jgi:hypothetical protein
MSDPVSIEVIIPPPPIATVQVNIGPPGPPGVAGEAGPPGVGVRILDTLPSTEDLPETGELGDGYLIDGDLWTWTAADEWVNAGAIQGPPGQDSTVPGPPGETGASAYEIAVADGFEGDETAWLASLVGAAGANGEPGEPGQPGETGPAGPNEVTTATDTDITGILKGTGTKVAQAVAGTDYVATNDARLSDARTPTVHAASHTNGTDDIQDATASVKGLATAAQITKLDGIATNANNYSHPNHSGDVTSVGDGATTIASNAVTFSKMQQISGTHLVGRHAGGSGNIQEVSVGNGIEFSGSGIRRAALTGDVTASAGSNSTTIADNAVTAAKMAATLDLSGKTLTLPSDVTRLGSSIDLASAEVTGTLPTANGGTGKAGIGNHKVLYSNGSGALQELSLGADGTYLKSNGTAAAPTFDTPAGGGGGGNWTLISTTTISGSPSVIDLSLTGSHRKYMVEFEDVGSALAFSFYMRTSSDGGTTFDSGSTDYVYGGGAQATYAPTYAQAGFIRLSGFISSDDNRGMYGELVIYDPHNTSRHKRVESKISRTIWNDANSMDIDIWAGARRTTSAVNAVRFYFEAGNFTNGGKIRLFGWTD